jgi:hypothetical protein
MTMAQANVDQGSTPTLVQDQSVLFTSVAAGGLPGTTGPIRLIGSINYDGPPEGVTAQANDVLTDPSGAMWVYTPSGTWANPAGFQPTTESPLAKTLGGTGLSESSNAALLTALGAAQIADNLSDLESAPTARTNLGLGTAAVANTSAFLQPANNLSDVQTPATARTNLGLGTAAVANTSAFLQPANNLSDVASAPTALTNLGIAQFASGNIGSNVSLTSGGATVITTASVAVGTWRVEVGITCQNGTINGAGEYEASIAVGTATATLTGRLSASGSSPSLGNAVNQVASLSLSCIAVVTVAGTLVVTGRSSTTGGTPAAVAATPTSSLAGATGYTAAKMA